MLLQQQTSHLSVSLWLHGRPNVALCPDGMRQRWTMRQWPALSQRRVYRPLLWTWSVLWKSCQVWSAWTSSGLCVSKRNDRWSVQIVQYHPQQNGMSDRSWLLRRASLYLRRNPDSLSLQSLFRVHPFWRPLEWLCLSRHVQRAAALCRSGCLHCARDAASQNYQLCLSSRLSRQCQDLLSEKWVLFIFKVFLLRENFLTGSFPIENTFSYS